MKNHWILFGPLLFAVVASSFNLVGIYPNAGPTDGETRVTIFSPDFKGMNYSDHPTPKCQFPDSQPQAASWIHCIGAETSPDAPKDETCLNCETYQHGAGTFQVQVSISGNFDDTATIDYTFYEQPTIGYLSPPLGSKKGGTFIQVHGQNFANYDGLACGFSTISMKATYVSPTLITCQSPPSEVTDSPIPVRVTLNGQQYTSSKSNYYYHSVPEISQLLPNEGSISGGTEVYLMGKRMHPFENTNVTFDNTTFARFGTDNYVKVELINATHAKVISPPTVSATPVPVELTFNDQEWTANGILFNYYVSPYVVRLVPNFGPQTGGTNVTVFGANFYNSSDIKCRFGTNVVQGTYINDNSISCTAPPSDDVKTVDFGLSVEGNHFSSNKIDYQYVKQPSITGISPSCGPITGETQVAITGKNFVFTGPNQVFCIFGNSGKYRQPATVINETLIYCDSPKIADKFGNNVNNITNLRVHLTLNGLEIIESKFDFTYYTMPTISTINPKTGPIAGGTQVVVSGDNFGQSCQVTCRFSTYEVEGKLNEDKTEVTCKSPAVTCPGQSLVQVSLNGQQYSTNDHTIETTIFSNYKAPVVAYALPTSFPSAGDSSVGVYGSGFLLSRNTSTLSNGEARVSYQCRFLDSSKKVLGTTNSTYFSDYYIHCKTPSLDSATDNVTIEISPNGQSWIPVPTETLSFYDSPAVLSVDPAFGKVKQTNATLTVKGRSFECQDAECKNVKCAFSGSNFRIVTDGSRENSTVIYCPIPSISRPEMTQVQVSLNGIDFTPQQVNYTFYDAFIVNVNPAFIPVEGNISINILGFGFANTPELKVRLENGTDGSVLHCADGKSCVIPANFTSPTEISFIAPPQDQIKGSDGASIGFRPFNVEVSVYGDSFTNDKVGLSFYQEPEVGGNITVNGAPATFVIHRNAIGSIFVPIGLEIPQGISLEDFLRRTRTLCKYVVEGETAITEGKIVEYPYPSADEIDLNDLSIECTAPQLNKSGDGNVSVSLNGVNFVGKLPIKVLPQLKINALTPRCGPREGGTRVDVQVGGVQQSEVTGFFFSWSSVCTNPFATGAFTDGNKISTVAPPAPIADTDGGYSLLVFSQNERTAFKNSNLTQQTTRNHFESSLDYLYYRRPTITKIYPHGGITTGGTPITIEGAFFFEDARTSCTPKCKFGETTVDAKFISTVRLQCNSPPGKLGAFVPLTVTFNGQDEAVAVERQQFAYIGKPNVKSLSPALGPATGGTMITVTGQGFVDMSQYPEEFACIFRPVGGSETPKVIPAVYLNSTAVACSSPGGWQPGKDAEVEISFNGVDFSNDKVRFRFYQIDRIWPSSGPSVGGSIVTIYGAGLVPNVKKGKAACKINNVVVEATKVSTKEIECTVPAATGGPTFSGRVDFYYTLDGDKWEQAMQGFDYYPQAEISNVLPKFVSANGGLVKVQGTNFNTTFQGANITCQINNSTVLGQYVSETELNCPFRNINYNTRGSNYVQVALNGASYTDKSDQTKINIYKVGSILPQSGVIEGGTKLIISGENFPTGTSPVCRFGVPGRSASSSGTFMNDNQIACTAPPALVSSNTGDPFMVPFSLNFDNETSGTFDRSGVNYYYYSQPEIADISPAQAQVDQTTLVTFTSSENSPFNNSIIGSTVVQQNSALELDIICKFGRFGTTAGALIAYNQIRCPTPSTRIDSSSFAQEAVQVQIALNGQDYLTVPTAFTFTGTGTGTGNGDGNQPVITDTYVTTSESSAADWFMPLVTAFVFVSFIFYITNRRFPNFNKEEIPLVGGIQRSDAIIGQEPTMNKIIM